MLGFILSGVAAFRLKINKNREKAIFLGRYRQNTLPDFVLTREQTLLSSAGTD